MRVYIAGPITGMPDDNRRAFSRAEEFLGSAGHEPINPHKVCSPGDDYDTCMEKDLKALSTCDALYALLGWENSPGAQVEMDRALELGLEIMLQKVTKWTE